MTDESKRRMAITPDRRTLHIETNIGDLILDAAGVDRLIAGLARARAEMQPPSLPGDVTPSTPMPPTTATAWFVSVDPNVPTCVRLCLFQRGYGWVWIPLNDLLVHQVIAGLTQAMQQRAPGEQPSLEPPEV